MEQKQRKWSQKCSKEMYFNQKVSNEYLKIKWVRKKVNYALAFGLFNLKIAYDRKGKLT